MSVLAKQNHTADIRQLGELALAHQLSEGYIVDRVNQWLTLVAHLGVLTGIVFLAYEIQINTNAVRSSTIQAFNESSFSWADSQMEYAAVLAEIYQLSGPQELTPEQQQVWSGFIFKVFTILESNHLQHQAGAMDDDLFEAKVRSSVVAILENGNGWWLRTWKGATWLSPDFKNYMDERIKAAQSAAPTGAIGLPLTLPPKMQRTVDEQDSWRQTPSTLDPEAPEGFGYEDDR